MLPELALNILDITENSTRAGATLVNIKVDVQPDTDRISVMIEDNGSGMTKEQIDHVTDPFYTTRTTRKVGLGVPFWKQEALATGGEFRIDSKLGCGTTVFASFGLSHVDRMPLGDITETIKTLIIMHLECDFTYTYCYGEKSFSLDTREMKELLGDVPIDSPEVVDYIRDYLTENKLETDGGVII